MGYWSFAFLSEFGEAPVCIQPLSSLFLLTTRLTCRYEVSGIAVGGSVLLGLVILCHSDDDFSLGVSRSKIPECFSYLT
jgi:hypothetical protein